MTPESFQQHIKIVAWLNIIGGAIFAVVSVFVFIFFAGIGIVSGEPEALGTLAFIGSLFGFLMMAAGLPGLAAGYGILKGRNWGRLLGIVVAVMNLFNFPIGTAIGGYSLWVLTDDNAAGKFS